MKVIILGGVAGGAGRPGQPSGRIAADVIAGRNSRFLLVTIGD